MDGPDLCNRWPSWRVLPFQWMGCPKHAIRWQEGPGSMLSWLQGITAKPSSQLVLGIESSQTELGLIKLDPVLI
jgi:hypothetical protein